MPMELSSLTGLMITLINLKKSWQIKASLCRLTLVLSEIVVPCLIVLKKWIHKSIHLIYFQISFGATNRLIDVVR